MMVSFAVQEHFSFMKSHALIVGLNGCNIEVLFRKSFSTSISHKVFPAFLSIRFRVSGLMLGSLIRLEIEFCAG